MRRQVVISMLYSCRDLGVSSWLRRRRRRRLSWHASSPQPSLAASAPPECRDRMGNVAISAIRDIAGGGVRSSDPLGLGFPTSPQTLKNRNSNSNNHDTLKIGQDISTDTLTQHSGSRDVNAPVGIRYDISIIIYYTRRQHNITSPLQKKQ